MKLNAQLVGFDPPPAGSGFTGGITASSKKSQTLAVGGATNQYDAVLLISQQIATTTTVAIDFDTDLDRYGVALNAVDVAAAMIENLGPSTGVLHVDVPAVDGWTSFLDSSGATDEGRIKLPPESGFLMWGLVAGTFAVGANNDRLELTEAGGGGQPADVKAQFLIRK